MLRSTLFLPWLLRTLLHRDLYPFSLLALFPQVLQEREKENETLRDAVQEHTAEVTELQDKLAEVEGICVEIGDKYEEHMAGCEPERAEKDADLLANNEEIQSVSSRSTPDYDSQGRVG